jgi:hypothetical protein
MYGQVHFTTHNVWSSPHKSWSAKSEKYNGVPLSWYTKQSSDYNEYYYLGKQKFCFKKRKYELDVGHILLMGNTISSCVIGRSFSI